MTKEALKLALEALEYASTGNRRPEIIDPAITAIKEALAQPEQELVATVIKRGGYRQWHSLPLGQLPDGSYTFYGKPS